MRLSALALAGYLLLGVLIVALAPPAFGKPQVASSQPQVAFGEPQTLGSPQPLTLRPDLQLAQPGAEGWLWRHQIHRPGAAFLRPRFAMFDLRPGDSLTVLTADGRVVERLTGRGPRDAGSFWGLSAFGDTLRLELRFAVAYDRPPFEIREMVVGDAESLQANVVQPITRSICAPADFEDAACYQADADKWANVLATAGVAVAGAGSDQLFCSGVNVSPRNFVLTNSQCLANAGDCANAEFIFGFYRDGCGSGEPMEFVSYRCNEIVASSPFSNCDATPEALDFALASADGDIAGQFGYAEPDPTALSSGEAVYIVQHAGERPLEITHGSGADFVVDGTVLRYFGTLDTESTSAGAPIFREADDALVGLHHCGGCGAVGVGNRGMAMADIHGAIEDFLCTPGVSLFAAQATNLEQVRGNRDAVIDPGETWRFTPVLLNASCAQGASNVTADVQMAAGSAAITLLDTSSSFGAIAAGAMAEGTPIDFQVDTAVACADMLGIDLVNLSATTGGPFDDLPEYLTATIGSTPTTTLLFEDFASGIPGTWTVVDGGEGSGDASTWTTDDPGGRSLLTPPFAIADSDHHGDDLMDEELITPVVDASSFSGLSVRFEHRFNWWNGGLDEMADVDVRSTATAGAWVNLERFSGQSAAGLVSVDAGGQTASDVQFRFRYHNASFELWWALDDVYLLGDNGPVCEVHAPFFSDGFETGTTAAWANVNPGP